VVTALSYGTTGLSWDSGCLASRIGLATARWRSMWPSRHATRAAAGDVDFTWARPRDAGPDAWQGLFEHGRLRRAQRPRARCGRRIGSMATQLAREAGAYSHRTGRAAGVRRLSTSAAGVRRLDNDALEDVGGSIWFSMSSAETSRSGLSRDSRRRNAVTITGPTEARPAAGLTIDFVVVPDRAQLSEVVQRSGMAGCGQTSVRWLPSTMLSPLQPDQRIKGKTIIRVRPEDSGLPNAYEAEIHAPKESLDVEYDYADLFLSHA